MNRVDTFDWVDFYKEFADKLLDYKDDRENLISKVRKIYTMTEIDLPTLEKDNKIVDIDPFTVFGLFNKSSMTDENRLKIVTAVSDVFEMTAPIPTNFQSVPLLNNMNATYYYFIGHRKAEDIDDLWSFFESALIYAAEPTLENRDTFSNYFDIVINNKGNGNSKITMGLYWIAPDTYLNLDRRNVWYIYKSGKIPNSLVSVLPKVESKVRSSTYLDIMEKMRDFLKSSDSRFKNFMELSSEAWRYSEEINTIRREEERNKKNEEPSIDEDQNLPNYWIYSPGENAVYWDEFYDQGIMGIGWDKIGDLRNFNSKEAIKEEMRRTIDSSCSFINDGHATWQFLHEMKPGDIVFVKKGLHKLVGRGIVQSEYLFDTSRSYFRNIRKIDWTDRGEWQHPGQAVSKTLTEVTMYTDYVNELNALFEYDSNYETEEKIIDYPIYEIDDFLEDVYMDRETYDDLVALVQNKKNVILQGAPGVGKTYVAKRLAYSMMGEKDPNRVMMVQFHQSYTYEDFIMGFRPSENGFELKRGAFYKFCKLAEIDSEREYFFIIDEINRGNLSKIFGELFMLIENDKRGAELQLLYTDEKFSVPSNIYIIGMMNTADRSLAMLDYALRRRFAFFEMKPGFDTEGFKEYRMRLENKKFDKLINCVSNLNRAIAVDEWLGEGFCIGHSYFCNLESVEDRDLSSIVEYELIPLLKEYWFDEPAKVKDWSNNLRSAIK